MMDNLSVGKRRGLALLILVVVAGLAYSVTVTPLLSLKRDYSDRIDNLERRLRIVDNKLARGDSLRARQAVLKQQMERNDHYLKSNTEALAGADLQRIIKRLAQLNQCEILSTQPLPSIQESGFNAVSLKVRMRGKLDNFVRIFHALETGTPYLFLDDLSIRSRIQHSRRIELNDRANANARRVIDLVETLDVEFDLTGYMMK